MKPFFFITLILLFQQAIAQQGIAYYLSEAKKNSPLIRDNQNQSQVNQLEAERLKAFYTKPQIGVTASYLFSPIINLDGNTPQFQPNTKGATDYVGYDLAASNSGQYQALLNVTQPLFNSKKVKTVMDQVQISSRINQNAVKISEHDLEKVITDQYILCLQDDQQLHFVADILKVLEEQKLMLQKLVASSVYKQSDLALLTIEYQNFSLQQVTYQSNYRRDVLDLNILCGIRDTAYVRLNDLSISVNESVHHSLYFEKYRLDSLAIMATQKTFELKYKPQLNVFANAGLNAVYAPTIPNRFGANAGLTFSYYFFDGKQKDINRHKTTILLQSVTSYKENFAAQNAVRKTKLLNEIQSYVTRINLSNQQVQEYQTLLSLYRKEIITGQLSIINYMTTLKNMAAAQRDNALLLSQQHALINAYNYWNW